MPKLSRLRLMPSLRRLARVSYTKLTLLVSALSLISRVSMRAGTPVDCSSAMVSAKKLGRSSCRVDTLTAMLKSSKPWSRQMRAWRRVISSTQAPIWTMMPSRSAVRMKRSGTSMPSVGDCQRSSASMPTTWPSRALTSGW